MPHDRQRTYLGDGLYASLDPGHMILLSTDRAGVTHWVGLEPEVFRSLIQFAHKIGWSKIIKHADIQEDDPDE